MTTLAHHTVMPPTETDEVANLHSLVELLEAEGPVALTQAGEGLLHTLPSNVREVLRQSVVAMIEHQAVTIAGSDTVLTTQEAAERLGVSRPTLVRLLEAGEIPFTKPNRHRRVLLEDVIAYQRRLTEVRRTELKAMTQDAVEDDSYGSVNGFVATR